MIKTTRFGAGCLLSRPEVFESRVHMLEKGEIGHVQLMMIPESTLEFQQNIEVFESYTGKIRVHAPHHIQQVNPCAPDLFSAGISEDIQTHIEKAMNQTFEAADRTGSKIIVLHAGRYQRGHFNEAAARFHNFLDQFPDPRYILESLPGLQRGYAYLGTTPDELKILGGSRITGYCPDFPHLWCTSLARGIPYPDLLTDMGTLPLRFSHLSGSPGPQIDRQHLLFDDPENRFMVDLIRPFLQIHQELEISLEFAVDDPAVITRQITIASAP
jgi:hypothetical protein